MRFLLGVAIGSALAAGPVLAQQAPQSAPASSLHWEGSVDAYYAYNFNHPADRANFLAGSGTSAKRANEASLNLASFGVLVEPEPVGFHLLLGLGNATDVVHSGEPAGTNTGIDVWRFVQTASVTYSRGRFGAEAGIYPSHIGLESFQSQANWAYTRSWMGELSPYYQAGLKLTYQFSDAWSAQFHVINGWQIIGENNHAKSLGTQVAYSAGALNLAFNTFAGPELPNDDVHWRLLGDLVAQVRASERWSFAFSTDVALQQRPGLDDAHWYAGQANTRFQVTRAIAIAARGEVFRDANGAISGTAQTLSEITATLEARPAEHLILKLEGRHDHSTAPVFSGSALVTGVPEVLPNQTLIVLGAVATL